MGKTQAVLSRINMVLDGGLTGEMPGKFKTVAERSAGGRKCPPVGMVSMTGDKETETRILAITSTRDSAKFAGNGLVVDPATALRPAPHVSCDMKTWV